MRINPSKHQCCFFMVHNKNVVLEFHSRICTAINAYNTFSNEIIKNQFSEKTTILLSNTVCQWNIVDEINQLMWDFFFRFSCKVYNASLRPLKSLFISLLFLFNAFPLMHTWKIIPFFSLHNWINILIKHTTNFLNITNFLFYKINFFLE